MVLWKGTSSKIDAYEYLIGQFAMESGKKAGEFYTPRQVSEDMAQIAAKTPDIKNAKQFLYEQVCPSIRLKSTVAIAEA